MLDRLGVVANCWKIVLDKGERFEELVIRFCQHGFKEIEIRDDDYLRSSSIGNFIDNIEKMAANYDFASWRAICNQIHGDENWSGIIQDSDVSLAKEIDRFVKKTGDAVFSYAMAFPWLSQPADIELDNQQISTAVKLAYLFNPGRPRLRLVSLEQIEHIDADAAVGNLKRYQTLMAQCPVPLTVENALHPAPIFLDLARAGGVSLAYDEANNYRLDGTVFNTPEEFWRSVRVDDLASVHLKQKSTQGALGRLGEGFVDLPEVMSRLRDLGYIGDLLLENAGTDDPLADAIASRAYVS